MNNNFGIWRRFPGRCWRNKKPACKTAFPNANQYFYYKSPSNVFPLFLICLNILLFSCTQRSSDPGDIINNDNESGQEITGNISGQLAIDNSPYVVRGNLIVAANKTLIIDQGVELLFNVDTKITIYGQLEALGTKTNPIVFKSLETAWKGIHIISGSGLSTLKFCVIQDILTGFSDSLNVGAVGISGSPVIISNTIFRNNKAWDGGALGVLDTATVQVKNCIFSANISDNFGGAVLNISSELKLINNTIVDNYAQNLGGGIFILLALETTIQNNIFYLNRNFFGPNPGIAMGIDTSNVVQSYNFLWDGASDPHFISETDFHLQIGSPVINSGNPAPDFNDVNGSRNDPGAYGGPGGDW